MKSNMLEVTMLYVEDDKETREQLTEIFKLKVKTLYVAEDGQQALELYKHHVIHFIVSDFQMPKMNGNELCRAVKEINPSVNFVLLTAYNDTKLLVDAIDAGVDKFLYKPIRAKELFGVLDEINEKITNKFQLERSNVCIQEAESIALLSYWDVNLDSGKINFSKEAKELFSLSQNEERSIDYKTFSQLVKEKDRDKFLNIFEKSIYNDDKIDEVVRIDTPLNKDIYIHIVAKMWKSSICGNKHIIGLFQDVSNYEIKMSELLKESQSDPALRILNKKVIVTELENLIKSSKRYGHPVGVIFFDIDDFKHINDTHGHLIADEILIDFATFINSDIRQSDYFGRWGGDEFIIITGYSSQEATILLADKLIDKIKNHSWKNNIKVTISIGISFYELEDDVNSLVDRADKRMFEAKKLGKNRSVF